MNISEIKKYLNSILKQENQNPEETKTACDSLLFDIEDNRTKTPTNREELLEQFQKELAHIKWKNGGKNGTVPNILEDMNKFWEE